MTFASSEEKFISFNTVEGMTNAVETICNNIGTNLLNTLENLVKERQPNEEKMSELAKRLRDPKHRTTKQEVLDIHYAVTGQKRNQPDSAIMELLNIFKGAAKLVNSDDAATVLYLLYRNKKTDTPRCEVFENNEARIKFIKDIYNYLEKINNNQKLNAKYKELLEVLLDTYNPNKN